MAGPSGFHSPVAANFRSHVAKLGFPEFPESLGWKRLLELAGGRGDSRQAKGHMTGQNESELSLTRDSRGSRASLPARCLWDLIPWDRQISVLVCTLWACWSFHGQSKWSKQMSYLSVLSICPSQCLVLGKANPGPPALGL